MTELSKRLDESLHEAIASLDTEIDFRKNLAALRPAMDKIAAVKTLADDKNTIFAAYMVERQLKAVQINCAGNETEWYKLNAGAINWFRQELRNYLKRIKEAFKQTNYGDVIDAAKDFLFLSTQCGINHYVVSKNPPSSKPYY